MSKSVLCILRWHKWKRMTTDDNKPFRGCVRCGKVDDDYFPPGSGLSVG